MHEDGKSPGDYLIPEFRPEQHPGRERIVGDTERAGTPWLWTLPLRRRPLNGGESVPSHHAGHTAVSSRGLSGGGETASDTCSGTGTPVNFTLSECDGRDKGPLKV